MIRKKTDSGWWEGELQVRGRRRQIGWFPATYVKLLQSGRLSGRSTPVSGGKLPMSEAIIGMFESEFFYHSLPSFSVNAYDYIENLFLRFRQSDSTLSL